MYSFIVRNVFVSIFAVTTAAAFSPSSFASSSLFPFRSCSSWHHWRHKRSHLPATSPSENTKEPDEYRREAEELKRKAQELLAEASAMERTISEARATNRNKQIQLQDTIIQQLFQRDNTTTAASNNTYSNSTIPVYTAIDLKRRMKEGQWSPEQLLLVIERLHAQKVGAQGNAVVLPKSPSDFQIADPRNSAEVRPDEAANLTHQIQRLVEAAGLLDEEVANVGTSTTNVRWTGKVQQTLKTRLHELERADEINFQRRMAQTTSDALQSDASVQDYMKRSLGILVDTEPSTSASKDAARNVSGMLEQIALVPMWVPSSLIPCALVARGQIRPEDVQIIRDDVLAGTEFYCTSTDAIPFAACFRGNIRGPPQQRQQQQKQTTAAQRNQTEGLFEEIQLRLEQVGLAERVQLFFLEDPEWKPGNRREPDPKPVILALPSTVVPNQGANQSVASKMLAAASITATVVATFAYSVSCFALNPSFFSSVVDQQDLSVLRLCLPTFVGVLSLQVIHEFAHWITARNKGLKIGRPVPVPSPQLGLFGCITPLRSFPRNRASLFDFSTSGPLAGMLTSLVLMVAGMLVTVRSAPADLAQYPVVPVALLKGSFLTGSIFSVFLPKVLMLPSSQPVAMSPFFVVGFAGLLTNALNMLPIGRLDGGRAYTAMFGPRSATRASLSSLFLLAVLSVTGMSSLSIVYGLYLVLFQRQPEIPIRNDVTELDDTRLLIYLAALALAFLTLAPFPGGLGFL